MADGSELSARAVVSSVTCEIDGYVKPSDSIRFLKYLLQSARGKEVEPPKIDWGTLLPDHVVAQIRDVLKAARGSDVAILPTWLLGLDADDPDFGAKLGPVLVAESAKAGCMKFDMRGGHVFYQLNAWCAVSEWLASGDGDLCEEFEKPNPRWPVCVQELYLAADACLEFLFWIPVLLQLTSKSTETGVLTEVFPGFSVKNLTRALQRFPPLQIKGPRLLLSLEGPMLSVTKPVVNFGRYFGQNWHDAVFKATQGLLDTVSLAANPSYYYMNSIKPIGEGPRSSDLRDNLPAVAESAMKCIAALEKAGPPWDMVHQQLRAEAVMLAERLSGIVPALVNDRTSNLDRRFMELAVAEARKSRSEDDDVHPKVGVVVVKDGKEVVTAYRGELGEGDHAEFTALEKKLRDDPIAGATVYTSLEPCTTRSHPKIPCAERLVQRKVKRVVIGMLDPNPKICGRGELTLREANTEIGRFDPDLQAEIEEMNREFIRCHRHSERSGGTP